MNARVLGAGFSVPSRVVRNADLAVLMDTSDEWIQSRTGIRERRHIGEDTGAADLGLLAAREALRAAGCRPGDLDLILFATLSPDIDWPASACLLQAQLGAPGIPALGVRNQCSGFLYGLAVANAGIRTGAYRRVLLVGAEVHSTGLDLTTRGREVGVLFGDGAGAVVLGVEDDPRRGILSVHLHSEGRYAKHLCIHAAGSRYRPRLTEEMVAGPDPLIFPRMDGRYVFKHAVYRLSEVVREALAANGYGVEDLDLLIPHQANLRINQVVVQGLGLPPDKVINNIDRYGNTTAASIPIAICEALAAGQLTPGALVCLAAFGAGFTWASALIRW